MSCTSMIDERESNEETMLIYESSNYMDSVILNMDSYESTFARKPKTLGSHNRTGEHSATASFYSDPCSSLKTAKDVILRLESDGEEIGPTTKRFIVIAIAAVVFFVQIFSQTIWNAIYEPTLTAFPNWSRKSLTLVPLWSSVMNAIFVFPACLTINKYGLKKTMLISCFFFTVGTAIRCLPFISTSTLYVHISAICLSLGSVVTTPLIITISTQWFPKTERNVATGFVSAIGMMGSATVYVIAPLVVCTNTQSQPDPNELKHRIMYMLYICFGFNLLITALVLLCFPKNNSSVSHISKLTVTSHQSAKLFNSLKVLMMDIEMWYLVLAFSLTNTVSSPWFSLLPSTFSQLQIPSIISARCSLFVIISTFILNLVISILADYRPAYRKRFAVITHCIALVFFVWLMMMLNFKMNLEINTLVCVVTMAFPFGWCSNGLMYGMGAELMFPLPPSFVAGYMTLMNNLFVDVVYIGLYFEPVLVKYCLNIGLVVLSVLSIVFLFLTPDRHEKVISRI